MWENEYLCSQKTQNKEIDMTKDIYLAGGCFWGTEHFFKQIEGVVETEVGFVNGSFFFLILFFYFTILYWFCHTLT